MLFGSLGFAGMLLASVASAADLTGDQLIGQGAALETAGNYAGAAKLYRAPKTLAGQSPDLRLVQTLTVLANSGANSGRWVEAEREYRQALTVAAAAVGKQSPEYALVLTSLAVAYWESSDREVGYLTAKSPPSLFPHVPERCSPSMVRNDAHKERGFDRSGPFRRLTQIRESGQMQSPFAAPSGLPLVGPELHDNFGVSKPS